MAPFCRDGYCCVEKKNQMGGCRKRLLLAMHAHMHAHMHLLQTSSRRANAAHDFSLPACSAALTKALTALRRQVPRESWCALHREQTLRNAPPCTTLGTQNPIDGTGKDARAHSFALSFSHSLTKWCSHRRSCSRWSCFFPVVPAIIAFRACLRSGAQTVHMHQSQMPTLG